MADHGAGHAPRFIARSHIPIATKDRRFAALVTVRFRAVAVGELDAALALRIRRHHLRVMNVNGRHEGFARRAPRKRLIVRRGRPTDSEEGIERRPHPLRPRECRDSARP